MFTELKRLDFENKIIMPFSTHEGSGLASIVKDIKKYAPNADLRAGLAIAGSTVSHARGTVEKWIKENIKQSL